MCEDTLRGPDQVVTRLEGGTGEVLEGDLPEEIARQLVADYAAEGETSWMERTAPAPE